MQLFADVEKRQAELENLRARLLEETVDIKKSFDNEKIKLQELQEQHSLHKKQWNDKYQSTNSTFFLFSAFESILNKTGLTNLNMALEAAKANFELLKELKEIDVIEVKLIVTGRETLATRLTELG